MEDHDQPYPMRVYQAYRDLVEEYQSPDVPIHAIHGRVRGSIHELHDLLRTESLAHRAVATTGEPAFAGDAAKQSALTLPGERESFLNVKLLNPPTMTQDIRESQTLEQQVQRYEWLLRETAALRYPESERTPELQARIEKTIRRKAQEFTQERQAKQYEASLRRQLAERHPTLTDQQREHYEQRIVKLVSDYRQNQAQQQPQQPARSQEQGRGIER